MTFIELIRSNLISPFVLAFMLGGIATVVKSDLEFPEQVYAALSIYLLLAIGMKGGVELSSTPLSVIGAPALATLALGICIPIWCYFILRKFGKFDNANAAAIAAHYGSVSAVTFTATMTFLDLVGVPFEGFMPTLVAILEVPAIIVALLIARMKEEDSKASWGPVLHEVITGKSILLMVGGVIIGLLVGHQGLESVAPVFVDPFKGVLMLFLLELGMVTGHRIRDLGRAGWFLVGFGVVMPILHGVIGAVLGTIVGLSMGGSTVLGVMAASASYIAAPAAVRVALPSANPGYYLTATLAITFPFNLALGIPLYYFVSYWVHQIHF